MGMTPEEFLSSFVQGNVEDFAEQPHCVRRGFNAAVAAAHMADHNYKYSRHHRQPWVERFPSFENYLLYLYEAAGQGFRDIRGISNAYKHLYTRSQNSISSAGSIDCVRFPDPADAIQSVEQDWVSSPSRNADGTRVIYRRRDGTEEELLPTLRRVVVFWLGELYGEES
ncbi:MAG TPA: hypothetical protein VFL86_16110 [Burkholderiaceae bacterium]|nr:hypothetical protein [Burkholderiaceae bacterium]